MKSPLRYPGGKSRAVKTLLPFVPYFEQYREPFVGGGSLFFALKELFPFRNYWVNDLNTGLFHFWHCLQNEPDRFIEEIQLLKEREKNGRELFYRLKQLDATDSIFLAIRFFVLNRISFSGTIDAGGYSAAAFETRFTQSSIDRLKPVAPLLESILITNQDYEVLVNAPGKEVFLFLDPPYLSAVKSKLYGKGGSLHTGFDHVRFAKVMKSCSHKWLITYDDCEEVRSLFSFANIHSYSLQYGMNNVGQHHAKKGKELIITNY